MPSSTWVHTSTMCDLIWKYQPKSVLDIGPGFGRWGFICREMLDVFRGRIAPDQWQTKIYGVEIFPRYLQHHHWHLYDKVYIDCGLRHLRENNDIKYDLIIAGDVLEHFPKDEGRQLIDAAYVRAKKAVIFCVPIGDGYPQGEVAGNKCEAHLAVWDIHEFKNDHRVTRVTTVQERIRKRPYGIVLMEKQNA